MKRSNYLYRGAVHLAAMMLAALSFQSCDILDPFEEKPDAVENASEFVFDLRDASGFLNKIYGRDNVTNAQVKLRSVTGGSEYVLTSDSTGVAKIKGIHSGNYMISVERKLTEDEVEKNTGFRSVDYKLVNRSFKQVCLDPAQGCSYQIPLQVVSGGATLLISEMYMCGPLDAGLYYHDKYFEIYNPTDSVQYLDGVLVALVYSSSVLGINYVNDPTYIHTTCLWKFPGSGKDYPLAPGKMIIVAEDAIDHRTNAPKSQDLSKADFEFFKSDAPDIDNPAVINMVKIYQKSGNDWISGGKADALVLARVDDKDLIISGEEYLFPIENVLDGAEYMEDATRLEKKELTRLIDAGATGGIQSYVGKSYERIGSIVNGRLLLKDNNNSSIDFRINDTPTPGYHYETGR